MTDVDIMKEMSDFERSHEGIYISYIYDDDEDIDTYWFEMVLNNYYKIERAVSGKYLCLILFDKPLPYIFEEMYQQLRKCKNERQR
jgi:hypothetical protein